MDIKNKKRKIEAEALDSSKRNQSNNRKKSHMNSGKTVLGMLVSFGLGALIGIAFAPQKGAKTRRKIIKKSEGYLDDFKEQVDDFLSEATDKIEKTWKDSEDFIRKEKAKFLDGKIIPKGVVL